jgi:hypothetical protein
VRPNLFPQILMIRETQNRLIIHLKTKWDRALPFDQSFLQGHACMNAYLSHQSLNQGLQILHPRK